MKGPLTPGPVATIHALIHIARLVTRDAWDRDILGDGDPADSSSVWNVRNPKAAKQCESCHPRRDGR